MVLSLEDQILARERARYESVEAGLSDKFYDLSVKPTDIEPSPHEQYPKIVISRIYEPSEDPADALVPIKLEALSRNQRHLNAVLDVRIQCLLARPPCSSVRSQASLQDPFITVVVAALGHSETTDLHKLELHNCFVGKPVQEILSQDTILRIRAPFYTPSSSTASADQFVLRVDHPTDIEIVDGKIAARDVESLKTEADTAYLNEQYCKAIHTYTQAIHKLQASADSTDLEESGAIRLSLHANRAAVYLSAGRYDDCIRDCTIVLDCQAHPKSSYRRAKALQALRRKDHQAVKHLSDFSTYVKTASASTPAMQALGVEVDHSLHQIQGTFKWADILKQSNKSDSLLVFDFEHTHIQTTQIPGKGNGVVAARDIIPGTLLVVSKALALVYEDDDNVAETLRIDLTKNTCTLGKQNRLPALLTQVVFDNPSMKLGLYDLFAGSEYADTTEDADKHLFSVDAFRMNGVKIYNSFESEAVQYRLSCLPTRKSSQHHRIATGVWRFPSYFNHSCLHNCSRSFVKDVLVIKAAKFIKAGDELTLGYVNKSHSFDERSACFKEFDFECNCSLCNNDRHDIARNSVARARREALLREYKRLTDEFATSPSVDAIQLYTLRDALLSIVQDMKETYASSEPGTLQYDLLRPFNALCTVYMRLHSWTEAIAAAQRISRLSYEDDLDDLHMDINTLLAALFIKAGKAVKSDEETIVTYLAEARRAWHIRGLVPGFGGFWDEYGEWIENFLAEPERIAFMKTGLLTVFLNPR